MEMEWIICEDCNEQVIVSCHAGFDTVCDSCAMRRCDNETLARF